MADGDDGPIGPNRWTVTW